MSVEALSKSFRRADGSTIVPVDDVSLYVHDGEFVVLLGPSGCGKTTLLRSIAGLETPDRGKVTIRGEAVFNSTQRLNVPPERRRLGMIFQSYALWPHLTAFQNVAYPLRAQKVASDETTARVMRTLETVGIPEIADQLPGRLSGGQQQRVALARALVAEPGMILFDEPLSNVDAKVREELRVELLRMQRRLGFTALYVTHDQGEAMELADRIAVLGDGKIAQLAPPAEVYGQPSSAYVAKFIGTANEVRGRSVGRTDNGAIGLDTELGRVRVPGAEHICDGDQVRIIWRPEATMIVDPEATGDELVRFSARAGVVRFLGAHHELLCTVGDRDLPIRVVLGRQPTASQFDRLTLGVRPEDFHVFVV